MPPTGSRPTSILHFGPEDAKRLIMGAAYAYKPFMENPKVSVPVKLFSDAHNAPPQRYYNLLCIAYGAHPQIFAEVVTKNLLPKAARRAMPARVWRGELRLSEDR